MKRAILICAALLLLCGCGSPRNSADAASAASSADAALTEPTPEAVPSLLTEAAPFLPPERDPLFGTWVNAGQYETGREFVETLTFSPDGSVKIHLDYQGQPYADLSGSWTRDGSILTFSLSEGTTRVYTYTVDGRTLILSGNDRQVEYLRN